MQYPLLPPPNTKRIQFPWHGKLVERKLFIFSALSLKAKTKFHLSLKRCQEREYYLCFRIFCSNVEIKTTLCFKSQSTLLVDSWWEVGGVIQPNNVLCSLFFVTQYTRFLSPLQAQRTQKILYYQMVPNYKLLVAFHYILFPTVTRPPAEHDDIFADMGL